MPKPNTPRSYAVARRYGISRIATLVALAAAPTVARAQPAPITPAAIAAVKVVIDSSKKPTDAGPILTPKDETWTIGESASQQLLVQPLLGVVGKQGVWYLSVVGQAKQSARWNGGVAVLIDDDPPIALQTATTPEPAHELCLGLFCEGYQFAMIPVKRDLIERLVGARRALIRMLGDAGSTGGYLRAEHIAHLRALLARAPAGKGRP